PTPTPRPERRRNARRSIVGRAFDRPRRRLWMNGEAPAAPDMAWPARAGTEFFLVNNMVVRSSGRRALVVALDVFAERVTAPVVGRWRQCRRGLGGDGRRGDPRQGGHHGGDGAHSGGPCEKSAARARHGLFR